MGVGNSLKSDDGIGPYVIENLKCLENDDLVLVNASTVPENFTGLIKEENPSHIIIIDATLMDKKPGTTCVFKKEDLKNVGMSTHAMSLSSLIRYLENFNDFKILFIGIEPENLDFSFDLSSDIKNSSDKLIELIKRFFI